ncbi:MAG: isoprenylcysteine carboxylmethyltransferase family protein [Candidatus Zixiibacteriota bacterium]
MPRIYVMVFIVSGFWILSEIGLGLFTHSSRREDVSSRESTSLKRLWLVIIPGTVVGGFWCPQRVGLVWLARDYVMYGGLALIVLGLVIRWRAIYTLRKYFTVDVSILEDHRIVKTGEYKFIRHPAYAGSLLSFFGLGWALGNWVSFLVIFLPILWAFIRRMNTEEKVLVASLGEEYVDYMKTTKRLIPKIY